LLFVRNESDQSVRAQCAVVAGSCMCGNLRRAARVVTQYYAKLLKPSGLEPTQFTLLVACATAGPVPISALAGAIATDRTTLTRNLRLLARQGLAQVTEGADRRVRRVEL